MGTNLREDCFVSDLKHPLFSRSETSFSLVPQPKNTKYGSECLACLNIFSENCGDVTYVSLSVNLAGKVQVTHPFLYLVPRYFLGLEEF